MSDISREFLNKLNSLQKNFPKEKELKVTGFYGSSKAYFFSDIKEKLFADNKCPVLFIFSQTEEAEEFYNDLTVFLGKENVFFFPDWEILPFEDLSPHPDIVSGRISVLANILESKTYFLVTSIPAIFSRTISIDVLVKSVKSVEEKEELDFEGLLTFLAHTGYQRTPAVEKTGEWSVRGGIVDFFTPGTDYPVRIEFSSDKVETIREFDPVNQKTKRKICKVTILPAEEFVEDEESSDLFEYLPDRTVLFLDDDRKIREKAKEFSELIEEGRQNYEGEPDRDYLSSNMLEKKIRNFPRIVFLPTMGKENDTLRFDFIPLDPFLGKIDDLEKKLSFWQKGRWNVEVFCDNEGQKDRLNELLSDDLISSGFVKIELGALTRGFKSESLKSVVFNEDEIWGRYRQRARYSGKNSQPFSTTLSDLRINDYVVHYNHGIGVYEGLQRLEVDGRESDYMRISYEGKDKLYLPVYEIGIVQKYIGSEGVKPRMSKLGGQSWAKAKKKVREKAANMAIELLELYSARQNSPGFSFSSDTSWQREFEASFIYEETDDQLRASREIKTDMENSKPMDRLLCGDVGYGKTEVAMRAVFKANMDGKQAAVLVPTTILAEQHFNTFRERMADYPTKIEMLSRFRSRQEQNKIIKDLKEGKIDVIIGTHRLVQKDVEFKDLGLAVIDEEHRFGVRHKDRLKKLRKNIDVLTMTATPIPRTLHLSLSEMSDISLINTPPEGRFPVKTFVEEYNERIISQAIRRELNRQGQIFFVHNRIDDLMEVSAKIKELCPYVSMGVAHGKMPEKELEKVMNGYFAHKFDLLLSTTIIESGLDISNANTIIIDRAEDFGLAQLYQLRGRVGRSHHQAYAYLFYTPHKIISQEAKKRLQAIFDFTDLGSGFKIAMRDMEIRGAGNILGKEQHGHIAEVGFELYCQILKEAVGQLKGEVSGPMEIPEVNLKISAYFSSDYIPDEHQKLSLYQRLAICQDEEEWGSIKDELEDRFGDILQEGNNLLLIVLLKIMMRKVRVGYIGEKQDSLVLKFSMRSDLSLKTISSILKGSNWEKKIRVKSPEPVILELETDHEPGKKRLEFLEDFFSFLMKKIEYNSQC